ncbi:MAG: C40 family peptidase [Eubacterium sp.]|nr:C40 family peptidase [Eubacterium sp.]
MRNWKRIAATATAGVFAVALCLTGIQAAAEAMAREEERSGAIVVVSDYCDKVADGELPATDPVLLAGGNNVTEPEVVEEEGPATEIESAYSEGEHVNLNLNYSRLGIANKVGNYLNVRKKPSKKGRIVGKMTKNAGCHIYKVKKGWAKIVSGKVKGYVKASYLTMDEKAEKLAAEVGRDCVEIQTDSLNVRALPSTTAPIYSVCDKGEEFEIKKENVDQKFLEKIIKKEKISDKAIEKAGGMDYLLDHMNEFICIYVDDDYAFVSKEYVKEEFSLKRATKVKQLSGSDGSSSSQVGIVSYAMQFLGNPYVWGGTSLTHGCDCSGFVMSLYAHYGKGLPHSSAAQAGCTRSVSNPMPGDLFFYGSGHVGHVAMYIGGGQVIHASNHRDGIKISNAYYRHPLKIGRVF